MYVVFYGRLLTGDGRLVDELEVADEEGELAHRDGLRLLEGGEHPVAGGVLGPLQHLADTGRTRSVQSRTAPAASAGSVIL